MTSCPNENDEFFPKSYINITCVYKYEIAINTIFLVLLTILLIGASIMLFRSKKIMGKIVNESPAVLYDETYNILSVYTLRITQVLLGICVINYCMYMVCFGLG